MKIKVAFLSSYLPKKGPVKVLLETVRHIDFEKFEVYIYTFKNETNHSYIEDFKSYPVTIKKITSGGKVNLLKKAGALKKELLKNEIQIVHSHCLLTLFISVFLKGFIRLNTIHIYPGLQLIKKKGALIGKVLNKLNKVALKKIDYPICCSKSISDEFKQNDNLDFQYIQNGVNRINYSSVKSRDDICEILNLDPSFKYFISFGRFSNEKNFGQLIEYFEQIDNADYRLIILGDGPLYRSLKLRESASIILPGFKENIYDYLYISDFYISTSLVEGLPMSVLEAMSMGKPVILSNIGPHREILFIEGAGTTFDLNVEGDFAKKFNQLVCSDYETLSSQSLKLFEGNFSSQIMSGKYQELYKNLI